MTFSDKICYKISQQIINDIFWKKYEPTINNEKTWYDNLNKFIVEEWNLIHDRDEDEDEEEREYKYTDKEEDDIIYNSFHLLLDKMNIDDNEYEDYEDHISWDRFDEIIGYYMFQV